MSAIEDNEEESCKVVVKEEEVEKFVGEHKPKCYGLFVGVKEYQCKEIENFEYSENDAESVFQFFHQKGGYTKCVCLTTSKGRQAAIHVHGNNVNESHNPNVAPTHANVLQLFREVKLDTVDQLLVYFSLHGEISSSDGEVYLLLQDSEMNRETGIVRNALSIKSLIEMLYQLEVRQCILILDCCHGGPRLDEAKEISHTTEEYIRRSFKQISKENFVNTMKEGRGFAWMAACPASQKTMEISALRHGVFTHYLLRALQYQRIWTPIQGTRDKFLRASDLYNHIYSKVQTACGYTPCFSGEFSGYMPIAYFTGVADIADEVHHSVKEVCPEDALPKDIDRILNDLRYARANSDFSDLLTKCNKLLKRPNVQATPLLKGLILSEKVVAQDVLVDSKIEDTIKELRGIKRTMHQRDAPNDTLDVRCYIVAAINARRKYKFDKSFNKVKESTTKTQVSCVSKAEVYYHSTIIEEVSARKTGKLTNEKIDELVHKYNNTVDLANRENSLAVDAYCARTLVRMANLILEKKPPISSEDLQKVDELRIAAKNGTDSKWVTVHRKLLKCKQTYCSDKEKHFKWARDVAKSILTIATTYNMKKVAEQAENIKRAKTESDMDKAFELYNEPLPDQLPNNPVKAY